MTPHSHALYDSEGPRCLPSLAEGTIVAGRFRLERLLGEGGMGTVWAARHVVTQRGVALKFLKGPASPELVQRFQREAQAANVIQHPNVLPVLDVFQLETGGHAMVMELLEGQSLAERLVEGPLSVSELAAVMSPIVNALGAIHAAGIVHRDLKPANVFLTKGADGTVHPMLLDFGICKLGTPTGSLVDSDIRTTAGRMIGTPCYMSPEQIRGAEVDEAADVWALGVILYECATGSPPWTGTTFAEVVGAITTARIRPASQLAPHLPHELLQVIDELLRRERARRLTTLAPVLDALRLAASSPAVAAPRQNTRVLRRSPGRESPPQTSAVETAAALRAPRARATQRGPMGAWSLAATFMASAVLGGAVALASPPSREPLLGASPLATRPAAPVGGVQIETLPAPSISPESLPLLDASTSEETVGEGKAEPALRGPAKRSKPLRPVTDFGGRR